MLCVFTKLKIIPSCDAVIIGKSIAYASVPLKFTVCDKGHVSDFVINILDNSEPAINFLDNAAIPLSMNTYILILRFE